MGNGAAVGRQQVTGSLLAAAGIPLIGTLAGTGSADRVEYGKAFFYTGPTEVSTLGSLSMLHSLDVKKAALAVTDAPASHTYVDEIVRPIAKEFGTRITFGRVLLGAGPAYGLDGGRRSGLDSRRFADLMAAAHDVVDPRTRADLLTEALALWHGDALPTSTSRSSCDPRSGGSTSSG